MASEEFIFSSYIVGSGLMPVKTNNRLIGKQWYFKSGPDEHKFCLANIKVKTISTQLLFESD